MELVAISAAHAAFENFAQPAGNQLAPLDDPILPLFVERRPRRQRRFGFQRLGNLGERLFRLRPLLVIDVGAEDAANANLVPGQPTPAVDSDGDGIVDIYDTATPTTAQGWSQVRSVRLAVLARSEQFEKEEVTASEPLWNVGTAVKVAGSID